MNLNKVVIQNYKSIEYVEFYISEINGSYTYSLLGINESGKTSFLKGLGLVDDSILNYPNDYFDESQPISIQLHYEPTDTELKELKKQLLTKHKFPKEILDQLVIDKVKIQIDYSPTSEHKRSIVETISFSETKFKNYTLEGSEILRKGKEDKDHEDFDIQDFFSSNYKSYFYGISHFVVFWESSSQYLLLDEIDLDAFAKDPRKISVPLLNCFILAGFSVNNLDKEISKLNNAVAINRLQAKLSELTTKHINSVWPDHPISITFQINNNKISLLIEDNGVKWQPKTTGQRSDGFKQFISFLLTVSVENHNKELTNTILLIDEPETHLHPPAQINLLAELIKITNNGNNNILIFATHSNYLIDKEHLNRNFKVFKKKNHKTEISQITKRTSSYAEVNYEVFNIITTDYHNELYGFIESEDKSLLSSLTKTKTWIDSRNLKEKPVSISEYIRHSIHHPENNLNKKFTDSELNESIKKLISLKNKIVKEFG